MSAQWNSMKTGQNISAYGPYLQLTARQARKLVDVSRYDPGLPFWQNVDTGVVIQAPTIHDNGRPITLAELSAVERVEAGCIRCRADLLTLLHEVAEGHATVLWIGLPPNPESFVE
jgi:hypothetical protein